MGDSLQLLILEMEGLLHRAKSTILYAQQEQHTAATTSYGAQSTFVAPDVLTAALEAQKTLRSIEESILRSPHRSLVHNSIAQPGMGNRELPIVQRYNNNKDATTSQSLTVRDVEVIARRVVEEYLQSYADANVTPRPPLHRQVASPSPSKRQTTPSKFNGNQSRVAFGRSVSPRPDASPIRTKSPSGSLRSRSNPLMTVSTQTELHDESRAPSGAKRTHDALLGRSSSHEVLHNHTSNLESSTRAQPSRSALLAQTILHPSQPTAQPAQATFQPVQPITQPVQPITQAAQPITQAAQPIAQPAQPIAQPAQPIAQPAQPIAQPAQPITQPTPVTSQLVQPKSVANPMDNNNGALLSNYSIGNARVHTPQQIALQLAQTAQYPSTPHMDVGPRRTPTDNALNGERVGVRTPITTTEIKMEEIRSISLPVHNTSRTSLDVTDDDVFRESERMIASGEWVEKHDKKNRKYYFNKAEKLSVWNLEKEARVRLLAKGH